MTAHRTAETNDVLADLITVAGRHLSPELSETNHATAVAVVLAGALAKVSRQVGLNPDGLARMVWEFALVGISEDDLEPTQEPDD